MMKLTGSKNLFFQLLISVNSFSRCVVFPYELKTKRKTSFFLFVFFFIFFFRKHLAPKKLHYIENEKQKSCSFAQPWATKYCFYLGAEDTELNLAEFEEKWVKLLWVDKRGSCEYFLWDSAQVRAESPVCRNAFPTPLDVNLHLS